MRSSLDLLTRLLTSASADSHERLPVGHLTIASFFAQELSTSTQASFLRTNANSEQKLKDPETPLYLPPNFRITSLKPLVSVVQASRIRLFMVGILS